MLSNTARAISGGAVAAVVLGALLVSPGLVPSAAADKLDAREERVRSDIGKTVEHLDQSSADLLAAAEAADEASAELSAAQNRLAETRGELAAASALDQQMERRLEAAHQRLRVARAELAEGQRDISGQEETLGTIAVQNYQQGDPDLLGLTMVMTTRDPRHLTTQLNSVQNVLDKESATLARLEASRILLAVQEETVARAERKVAVQRQKAARELARKQQLEKAAEAAEAQVASLSELRIAARDAAAEARDADLEQLRGLQEERDKIAKLLRERAEEARSLAEAAAAAADDADGAVDLGSRVSNDFLDYPVDGYITSSYGMRLHPVYQRWSLHDGTDFGAGCGVPIRAAANGTVVATYYNAGYGNRVIMDNGFHRGVGLGTTYNHLTADSVSPGEEVRRGEIIGYVGSTGYSTGCHLHFMVLENGVAVNPMNWL